jgi:hypothetical protein
MIQDVIHIQCIVLDRIVLSSIFLSIKDRLFSLRYTSRNKLCSPFPSKIEGGYEGKRKRKEKGGIKKKRSAISEKLIK